MSEAAKFVEAVGRAPVLLGGAVEIIDHPEHSYPCIKFKIGMYKDVVVGYGRVQFAEVGEELQLSFDYELVADEAKLVAVDEPKFQEYIGDLLTYLILCSWGATEGTDWADYSIT